MNRQEGVEGGKDRIRAPRSHSARRVLPAVGEEVALPAPVPVFLQRLGERQGAQAHISALRDQAGSPWPCLAPLWARLSGGNSLLLGHLPAQDYAALWT